MWLIEFIMNIKFHNLDKLPEVFVQYLKNTVNVLLTMCWSQYNDTPLDLAIKRNKIEAIHYFVKDCQQDITKIKQVCNCVALFLIVANVLIKIVLLLLCTL